MAAFTNDRILLIELNRLCQENIIDVGPDINYDTLDNLDVLKVQCLQVPTYENALSSQLPSLLDIYTQCLRLLLSPKTESKGVLLLQLVVKYFCKNHCVPEDSIMFVNVINLEIRLLNGNWDNT